MIDDQRQDTDQSSGAPHIDVTSLELGGDIVAAKQRVLPDVAANLGYRIVAAVVEYW